MILKGAQRSGAKALAKHLLNEEDNDFVEVHQIRGFLSDDMTGAFKEVQAIAKGTRCKQPFFAVSLSPPAEASVSIEAFEDAINQIEAANNLTNQPRVIVFHEKDGRRHAHAVWSRINAETMTARNLSHFKTKLQAISRDLFFTHQWKMPKGLLDRSQTNPTNVTLAEWQSAKRRGRNAIDQKKLIQQCWAVSDDRASFASALEEYGYILAQGTRRGHVIVAHDGEVFAVARATAQKAKQVRARLGDPTDLPSVAQALDQHKSDIHLLFVRMAREARVGLSAERARLNTTRSQLIKRHRAERAMIDAGQSARWQKEAAERSARLSKGLAGLWQRISGARARTIRLNEAEALAALHRDREQRQRLIEAQLAERQKLEQARSLLRQEAFGLVQDLRSDRDRLVEKLEEPRSIPTRVSAKAHQPEQPQEIQLNPEP